MRRRQCFGHPAELFSAADKGKAGDVLPAVYSSEGNVLWVGQLDKRTEPDMAKFDETKEAKRQEVLLLEREDLWTAWVKDQVTQASVSMD